MRPVPGEIEIIYGNWVGAAIGDVDREDVADQAWEAPGLTVLSSHSRAHWEAETEGIVRPWYVVHVTVVGCTDVAPIARFSFTDHRNRPACRLTCCACSHFKKITCRNVSFNNCTTKPRKNLDPRNNNA